MSANRNLDCIFINQTNVKLLYSRHRMADCSSYAHWTADCHLRVAQKEEHETKTLGIVFFYFFASSKCVLQLEGPHLDRLGKIQVARSCRHARPLSLSFSLSITCRLFVSARRDKGRHKINEHQEF